MNIKKVEFKKSKLGNYCEYFKINGDKFGEGIERIEIIIDAYEPMKIKMYGRADLVRNKELFNYEEVKFYEEAGIDEHNK